ncbi:peptidase M23B [Oceanicola sp. 22II-s10i]|uniref:murein hydrolase activator EnvC family protein n=1 Tax=Oceanicola sp. 22II-s10i TaxID=1317116 RepID=UPI000B52800D|nr:peptidoglycan DD-metalloendopeptidase family protein [Oceanicola sp. 22II-s10i]OWU86175.1 peptidase M23B [Oceanicola sp. 22II-s10i]
MTLRRALFAALLALTPPALMAEAPDPGAQARAAAKALEEASAQLATAEDARDRVKALTATLRAFETGLGAMREGLRRVSLREAELQAELDAREAEIGQLLGVLQTMTRDPLPVRMLHPSGPVGTARSGMILSDVAPALETRVTELRRMLEEARDLHALQDAAAARLRDGLDGVQQARAALSQAVADRTSLPRRFTEDPVKTALLIASTETLEAFASGLTDIAENEAPGSLPDITERRGTLPLPVEGTILRRAGDTDAAGVTRQGIVVATRPGALVTTPTAATIRYRGPLLSYGNVMILEPQAGTLFVLAGLDVVYGAAGEVLPAGNPVGLMGGRDPSAGAILQQAGAGGGSDRTESLYIEVRQDNVPQDPETWFRTTKDE